MGSIKPAPEPISVPAMHDAQIGADDKPPRQDPVYEPSAISPARPIPAGLPLFTPRRVSGSRRQFRHCECVCVPDANGSTLKTY